MKRFQIILLTTIIFGIFSCFDEQPSASEKLPPSAKVDTITLVKKSSVNLQLKLNQFWVDFALNIDPAKNWPSTDSSVQESNFMGHLFNAIVVQ